MSTTAFAIRLGSGFYVDCDGVTYQRRPSAQVIYDFPFKIPIEPSKIEQALTGTKDKLLKFTSNSAGTIEEFKKAGLLLDVQTIAIIAEIGKIAGAMASIVGVAAMAVDLLRVLGFFKSGNDGNTLLLEKCLNEIEDVKRTQRNQAYIDNLQKASNAISAIKSLFLETRTHVEKLNGGNYSVRELKESSEKLRTVYNGKWGPGGIDTLFEEPTWYTTFDQDTNRLVWPTVAHVLYTLPESGTDSRIPALFPVQGGTFFNHDVMMRAALWAAETVLASFRAIQPRHRTTRDFAEHLLDMAKSIEGLAQVARKSGLARTIYRREDFVWDEGVWEGLQGYEVLDPDPTFPEEMLMISPICSRWPVGAIDLCRHNDPFFRDFLLSLRRRTWPFGWEHFPPLTGSSKFGHMDFRWLPPARLQRKRFDHLRYSLGPAWGYVILNPEECAAAANEQAELDYANLIAGSGYLELVRVAALLRTESLEPNSSQTVDIKPLSQSYDAMPSITVSVESAPNPLLPNPITSVAKRQPRFCRAEVMVRISPIPMDRPLPYKIFLRSLRSITGRADWRDPLYSEYYKALYKEVSANKGDLEVSSPVLSITTDRGSLIGEHLITSGSNPAEVVEVAGEVDLRAHTFDWWIPVESPYSLTEDSAVTTANLSSLGSSASTVIGSYPSRRSPAPQVIRDPVWKNAEQNWSGEKREVMDTTVLVKYRLGWYPDGLSVYIENRPVDRNYVVFLVLEETMPGSSNILQTAIQIPVNGQLTYVPKQFFEDENKALERGVRDLIRFNNEYRPPLGDGPERGGLFKWVRPGDWGNKDSLDQMALLARSSHPDLLDQIIADGQRNRPV